MFAAAQEEPDAEPREQGDDYADCDADANFEAGVVGFRGFGGAGGGREAGC